MRTTLNLRLAAMLLAGLCIAGTLTSCEPSTTPNTNGIIVNSDRALFVLNQGQFTKNNATLDEIVLKDSNRIGDLIPNLGDAGNDIELFKGKLYAVMDNSNKVVVVNPENNTASSILFPNGSGP